MYYNNKGERCNYYLSRPATFATAGCAAFKIEKSYAGGILANAIRNWYYGYQKFYPRRTHTARSCYFTSVDGKPMARFEFRIWRG